jgi:myo-inositol 2-dehydrogenase/D-chiro-inositol 1-dehydrogenase
MRIGLAGAGRIGAFHASTLAALDDVDQVVVTDARPSEASRLATERGYEFSPDLDDLLSRVDALVITTSTVGHAPTLRSAVAAKVPTFCEKPVAATLAETIELVDLVGEVDVPVQIGFQRRFDAGYQRAREAVVSGELGFVHTVRANTGGVHPDQWRPLPGLQHP